MSYIDENLKNIDEDKTIGIIIVVENNENIIKYFINDRIYAKEFELVS